MSTTMKSVFLGLLFLLAVIQLFRIDKTNPELKPGEDFLTLTSPGADLGAMIKDACYDCHSNETKYPWYTNVAPVSWWIKKHINEGREELNFSLWAGYEAKRRIHKMEEAAEMVHEGEMPLKSYIWMHPEADLSAAQEEQLVAFFKAQMVREELGTAPEIQASPTGDEEEKEGRE